MEVMKPPPCEQTTTGNAFLSDKEASYACLGRNIRAQSVFCLVNRDVLGENWGWIVRVWCSWDVVNRALVF